MIRFYVQTFNIPKEIFMGNFTMDYTELNNYAKGNNNLTILIINTTQDYHYYYSYENNIFEPIEEFIYKYVILSISIFGIVGNILIRSCGDFIRFITLRNISIGWRRTASIPSIPSTP